MQILSNPDYDKIIAYWSNKGAKPSAEESYTGIMKLAAAAKLENTLLKPDVIDAMFRQPHSPAIIPFKPNIITDETTINAVDYDLGRNGIAYYDTDTANYHVSTGKREPWNRGNVYRNDGVDISADSATKSFYYVTHIDDGEWLQYTLTIISAGGYNLKFNYAAKQQAGEFLVQVNKKQVASVELPVSKNWGTAELKNIRLSKGINEIRVMAKHGGIDFKSIEFKKIK